MITDDGLPHRWTSSTGGKVNHASLAPKEARISFDDCSTGVFPAQATCYITIGFSQQSKKRRFL